MKLYVGLDVSLAQTAVCILNESGEIVAERLVDSEPEAISGYLANVQGKIARIGLEAGPMAPWLFAGLSRQGLPVVCIEVRQMKAFAKASPVKTDKRDARLIGQAMRTGLFKATHVKTDKSQRLRLLLRHRQAVMRRNKDLINTVRGTLKAFGIRTGGGKSTLYARQVREAVADQHLLTMTEPLLVAYEQGLAVLAELDRMVLAAAREDAVCRLLMTVPGVGAVTALAFRTGIDLPERFAKSRLVGAVLGLTPRVYASGESEHIGRIAKCGDGMTRWLLYEAANVMLTRVKGDNWLKSWAIGIAKRRGMRKAKVALARRLAVVMHAMWISGQAFSPVKPL